MGKDYRRLEEMDGEHRLLAVLFTKWGNAVLETDEYMVTIPNRFNTKFYDLVHDDEFMKWIKKEKTTVAFNNEEIKIKKGKHKIIFKD